MTLRFDPSDIADWLEANSLSPGRNTGALQKKQLDRVLLPLRTRTEYLFMDRAYHQSMSRIYFAVPADRMVAADALSRGVPEDDEEEDEEEQGEDQEQDQEQDEEEDDRGEGYSE